MYGFLLRLTPFRYATLPALYSGRRIRALGVSRFLAFTFTFGGVISRSTFWSYSEKGRNHPDFSSSSCNCACDFMAKTPPGLPANNQHPATWPVSFARIAVKLPE